MKKSVALEKAQETLKEFWDDIDWFVSLKYSDTNEIELEWLVGNITCLQSKIIQIIAERRN